MNRDGVFKGNNREEDDEEEEEEVFVVVVDEDWLCLYRNRCISSSMVCFLHNA